MLHLNPICRKYHLRQLQAQIYANNVGRGLVVKLKELSFGLGQPEDAKEKKPRKP